jgi:hypothetical protein
VCNTPVQALSALPVQIIPKQENYDRNPYFLEPQPPCESVTERSSLISFIATMLKIPDSTEFVLES